VGHAPGLLACARAPLAVCPSGMPGSLSYDKLAYFTAAVDWAKRLRNAAYPESAANLYVEANRGKGVSATALTSRLAKKGVPRCNAACQLAEVRAGALPGDAWHWGACLKAHLCPCFPALNCCVGQGGGGAAWCVGDLRPSAVCSCALCGWPAQFWFCAGGTRRARSLGSSTAPWEPSSRTTARRASRAPGTAPPPSSLTSEVGPYLKTARPDGTACKGLCNTTNCIYSNQSCGDYCAVSAGAPCNYSATCTADSCTCQSGACKNAFVPGASCASCASGDCLVSDTGDCVEFCAANSNGTTCASCSNPDGCKCSGGQCVDLCLWTWAADASPSVGSSCSCNGAGVCSPSGLGVNATDVTALRHRALIWMPTRC